MTASVWLLPSCSHCRTCDVNTVAAVELQQRLLSFHFEVCSPLLLCFLLTLCRRCSSHLSRSLMESIRLRCLLTKTCSFMKGDNAEALTEIHLQYFVPKHLFEFLLSTHHIALWRWLGSNRVVVLPRVVATTARHCRHRHSFGRLHLFKIQNISILRIMTPISGDAWLHVCVCV